jgi:hypothetical protein
VHQRVVLTASIDILSSMIVNLFLEQLVKWIAKTDSGQLIIMTATDALVQAAQQEDGPGRLIDEL